MGHVGEENALGRACPFGLLQGFAESAFLLHFISGAGIHALQPDDDAVGVARIPRAHGFKLEVMHILAIERAIVEIVDFLVRQLVPQRG